MIAKEYLKKIRPDTYNILEDQGVFRSDFDYQLQRDYLTRLLAGATRDHTERQEMEFGLELLIEDVMRNMVLLHEDSK